LPFVPGWPRIDEPELLERLAMDDPEFRAYIGTLMAAIPPRAYESASLARAIAYPWARPPGSYRLTGAEVEPLEEMRPEERERAIREFASAGDRRQALLAIGSNGAPEVLERKFAHFPEDENRAVLALTGRLHDFDVGFAAQPALYGSMPATLFPSPGTAVAATVLWVTPVQLTQLVWSEISYRLGRLRARFEVDGGETGFDEVLVFVSRWGSFCLDGEPVAMAAIPATGRTTKELTQEQALDTAASLALGAEAKAETLVRAIFEDLDQLAPRLVATVNRESQPFGSDAWTPYGGK
jgi:hypothetical protein